MNCWQRNSKKETYDDHNLPIKNMTCICSTILFLHIFCCSETKSKRPLKGQTRPRSRPFTVIARTLWPGLVYMGLVYIVMLGGVKFAVHTQCYSFIHIFCCRESKRPWRLWRPIKVKAIDSLLDHFGLIWFPYFLELGGVNYSRVASILLDWIGKW